MTGSRGAIRLVYSPSRFVAVVLVIALTGCATLTSNIARPSQIPISSSPPGAQVYVNGIQQSELTPTTIELTSTNPAAIEIRLPGYERVVVSRKKVVNGWFWANLVFVYFFFIGMLVDGASGTWRVYDDGHIHVTLIPAPHSDEPPAREPPAREPPANTTPGEPTRVPEPKLPKVITVASVCVEVDGSADELSEAARVKARYALVGVLEGENLLVVDAGCSETYKIWHRLNGDSVVVHMAGPRGNRKHSNGSLGRLAGIYSKMVRSLLAADLAASQGD